MKDRNLFESSQVRVLWVTNIHKANLSECIDNSHKDYGFTATSSPTNEQVRLFDIVPSDVCHKLEFRTLYLDLINGDTAINAVDGNVIGDEPFIKCFITEIPIKHDFKGRPKIEKTVLKFIAFQNKTDFNLVERLFQVHLRKDNLFNRFILTPDVFNQIEVVFDQEARQNP